MCSAGLKTSPLQLFFQRNQSQQLIQYAAGSTVRDAQALVPMWLPYGHMCPLSNWANKCLYQHCFTKNVFAPCPKRFIKHLMHQFSLDFHTGFAPWNGCVCLGLSKLAVRCFVYLFCHKTTLSAKMRITYHIISYQNNQNICSSDLICAVIMNQHAYLIDFMKTGRWK